MGAIAGRGTAKSNFKALNANQTAHFVNRRMRVHTDRILHITVTLQ